MLQNLLDTKKEYLELFQDLLATPISERLYNLYKECQKQGLREFQNILGQIPNWNNFIIEKETKNIITKTKCTYLQKLLKAIISLSLEIKFYPKLKKMKKIYIKYPSLDDYIHKCYINASIFAWKHSYLFSQNNLKPAEIQNNINIIESNIHKIVAKTIIQCINLKEVLDLLEEKNKKKKMKTEDIFMNYKKGNNKHHKNDIKLKDIKDKKYNQNSETGNINNDINDYSIIDTNEIDVNDNEIPIKDNNETLIMDTNGISIIDTNGIDTNDNEISTTYTNEIPISDANKIPITHTNRILTRYNNEINNNNEEENNNDCEPTNNEEASNEEASNDENESENESDDEEVNNETNIKKQHYNEESNEKEYDNQSKNEVYNKKNEFTEDNFKFQNDNSSDEIDSDVSSIDFNISNEDTKIINIKGNKKFF